MHTIDFTIEFISDWHIGTGSGRHGHLDRTYDRDELGLPFVGARSLKGVLRTSMERIVAGLDNGGDAGWTALSRWLLGSQPTVDQFTGVRPAPLAGALIMDRALVGKEVAEAVRLRPGLRRALSVERPGVMLDDLGVATDDNLRFIEMAPTGLVLHGRCHLPDDAPAAAHALVAASLRDITRLGHRRRRGWGECRVLTPGFDASSVNELAGSAPEIPSTTDRSHQTASNSTATMSSNHELKSWHITMTALSPLLLPQSRTGNDVASRSSIPGSTLLALLGGVAPQATRSGVSSGALRMGEATPLVAGSPSIPVPLSWFRTKEASTDAEFRIVNGAATADEDRQVVQVRHGFVAHTSSNGVAALGDVRTERRVHVAIDDATQSAQDEALFSYVAVVPGTRYCTALVATEAVVEAIVAEAGASTLSDALVDRDFRVGSSRRNEYGHVRVDAVTPVAAPAPTSEGSAFTVWLASDTVVVDSSLRADPTTAGFAAVLSNQLGRPVEVTAAFTRRVRRESWHGRWGLPRPTIVGIAAGSVFECKMADGSDAPVSELAQLGVGGVGDRTGEGLGRFRVNDPLLRSTRVQAAATPEADTTHRRSGGDVSVLKQLTNRSWELLLAERLELALARGVHHDLALGGAKPGRSQLGALRSAARSDLGDLARLKEWWHAMKSVPRRQSKWPRPAVDAIDRLLAEPMGVFQYLHLDDSELAALGGDTNVQNVARFAAQATAVLIAAAARAAQRDAHNNRSEDEE